MGVAHRLRDGVRHRRRRNLALIVPVRDYQCGNAHVLRMRIENRFMRATENRHRLGQDHARELRASGVRGRIHCRDRPLTCAQHPDGRVGLLVRELDNFARHFRVGSGTALAAHRLMIDRIDEHDAVAFGGPQIARADDEIVAMLDLAVLLDAYIVGAARKHHDHATHRRRRRVIEHTLKRTVRQRQVAHQHAALGRCADCPGGRGSMVVGGVRADRRRCERGNRTRAHSEGKQGRAKATDLIQEHAKPPKSVSSERRFHLGRRVRAG